MGRGRRTQRRSDNGAAAVEFALVMIPLLYLVFGAISYGYMFSYRQALSQSASEGARAAVGAYNVTDGTCANTGPFTAATCPAQAAAANAVKNSLNSYGQSCGAGNLTCTIKVGAATVVPGCAAGHVCISVAVSYPYKAHSLLPSVPGYGFVLPNTLSFTSVVELS